MCDTSHMTDRSRLVLAIADQRARNLGLKAVMPEHLLLALAAEGNSIASHVLRYVGAENDDVQDALSAGQIATLEDKTPRLPCDDATKHVLVQSSAELIPLRHNYIGPEHLILGLSVVAPELFERFGIKPGEIRSEVYAILGHNL
jgi:ATP-dependent Clp protease ATP-binding subunit ClpC